MEELQVEGLAAHGGPGSCATSREGCSEVSPILPCDRIRCMAALWSSTCVHSRTFSPVPYRVTVQDIGAVDRQERSATRPASSAPGCPPSQSRHLTTPADDPDEPIVVPGTRLRIQD